MTPRRKGLGEVEKERRERGERKRGEKEGREREERKRGEKEGWDT